MRSMVEAALAILTSGCGQRPLPSPDGATFPRSAEEGADCPLVGLSN